MQEATYTTKSDRKTTVLQEKIWKEKLHHHHRRIDAHTRSYLYYRERGHRHPVHDFLFEYYSFRPSYLRRWSPGINIELQNGDKQSFSGKFGFRSAGEFRYLDVSLFPPHRLEGLDWTLNLLRQTAGRSPSLGCYGLHEWAMVYKQGHNRRHSQVPLRMSPEKLDAFVESQNLVCTHYDAFRFYTEEAKPLNRFQPTRKSFPETEQPGCLHTNMDLYKWAYKFYPWVDSDLIADCFELAIDIRSVDMKASPYDLRDYGYDPIKIETEDGKAYYRSEQKRIASEAEPIRESLINSLATLKNEVSRSDYI